MTAAKSQGPRGSLLRDSQVTQHPTVEDRYEGSVPDAWMLFAAFGGMSLAVALRAAQQAANQPSFTPFYASAMFCRPLACGPVHVDTEVLMRSASVVEVAANLHPVDDERTHVRVLAGFGASFPGPGALQQLSYPAHVLPPEDAIANEKNPLSDFPLLQQSTTRWAHDFWNRPGRAPSQVAMNAEPAEVCSWIRFNEPPLRSDGTWDPLTFAAPADYMAPALFRGLGSEFPPFYPTTLAMDLHIFATTRHEWILQRCRIMHFGDGYACGVVELWDQDRTLLAFSTQRRFCKPIPPEARPKFAGAKP